VTYASTGEKQVLRAKLSFKRDGAALASLRAQTLPFSIFNQPQKASRTGCVGLFGHDLLSEQRIAYVAHVAHELFKDIVRERITEAVNQATHGAH
jgi:hypothetical protein